MQNLQTIVLPRIVLYAPDNEYANEIETRLKINPDIEYISDACEYREKTGKKRSWLFCKSLTYTIDDLGYLRIKYKIGDSKITHIIHTNDTFYIDISKVEIE